MADQTSGPQAMTLRGITEGILLAQRLLGEADDLLTPEQRAEVEQALRQFAEQDLPHKAGNYAAMMQQLEVEAGTLDAEIKRLTARKSKRVKAVEWLKGNLLQAMQSAGVDRLDSPRFTVTRQANPPAVVVYDETLLPEEYLRRKPAPAPEPDRVAIGKAIKGGAAVPGARLEQGESLRIR